MGEIADDMLEGACCSICGQYFKHPKTTDDEAIIYIHGLPVVCWDCWDIKLEEDHMKAKVKTF